MPTPPPVTTTPPPASTAATPVETEATATPATKPNPACDTPQAKDPPADFVAMMAAQMPAEIEATPQIEVAPKLPETEIDAAPAPMQPDQLLALLAGSQAIVAAPAPVTPQTPTPAPTTTDATTARAIPIALPLPAPAAPQAQAQATPTAPIETKPTAASTPVDVAANDSAPTFDTLLVNVATQPVAPTTPTVARAEVIAAPLAMPVDPDTGFDDSFSARIGWMAGEKIGHAQIRISPADLGPIDVRVQVDGTRVNAEFHSAHVEVRQALEASVPRLRELLGQQGLQLGHADVGHRRPDSQRAQGDAPQAANDDVPVAQTVRPLTRSRGLLDEYA